MVHPVTDILPGVSHSTVSILTIHSAELEDEGLYICEATETYHEEKETKEIFIQVIGEFIKTSVCLMTKAS